MTRSSPAGLLALSGGFVLGLLGALPAGANPADVTNGEVNTGDPHVVALQYKRLTCGPGATPDCSGTLIAPRAVLTAAHCVESGIVEGVQVFFGTDTDAAGQVVYPSAVLVHPFWDPVERRNDLAILVLPFGSTHTPVPLFDGLDDAWVGEPARVAGFGTDGPGGTPGVKRTGTALIVAVGPDDFEIAPAPSMSCQADSGGPVFVRAGGVEYLAGVTAWGDQDCAELGVNTRVDTQLDDFILPALDSIAGMPEGEPGAGLVVSTAAVCGVPCAIDADCPASLTCSEREDGWLCRYEGLDNGFFAGDRCSEPGDCPNGTCVALEGAGVPECACYTECDPTRKGESKRGCGCEVGRSSPGAALLVVCAVAVLRRRRGQRISEITA